MCKNEYRRLGNRKNMAVDGNIDQYYGDGEASENENQLTAEQIFREINDLDEAEKTVFLLYYREDFSLREISQVLGLPEGTIKSKLFYIRKKISRKLQITEKDKRYEKT